MDTHPRRLTLLLFAVPLISGCTSFGGAHSARTLDARTTVIGAAFRGVSLPEGTLVGTDAMLVPSAELILRRGLTDRFELGGRLLPTGISVDAKFGFFRSDDPRTGFNAAALGVVEMMGTMPLGLFAIPVSYRWSGYELALAPKVGAYPVTEYVYTDLPPPFLYSRPEAITVARLLVGATASPSFEVPSIGRIGLDVTVLSVGETRYLPRTVATQAGFWFLMEME